MEIPILAILLASFVLSISSHPKHSDIVSKEYYKRQILQPIPGYIPVYIKAEGEPLVRSESKKQPSNVHPQKATEPREKNFSKHADRESLSKNDGKKSEKTDTEKIIRESKKLSMKYHEEAEPKAADSSNQYKNHQIAYDGHQL